MVALSEELNDIDKEMFNFRIGDLDWEQFTIEFYRGTRQYVLKYKPETIPACKRRLRIMYLVYHIIQGFVAFGLIFYIYKQLAPFFAH